ncbi:hypothetical protein HFP72_21075 [Nocardiopsis sp. ARC36]
MPPFDDDDIPDPARDPEEFADYLFDAVSGTLRDRPEAGAWATPPSRATKADLRAALNQAAEEYADLRRSLVESDEAFDGLHEWLMDGNPLPDPWRKHFVPAPDEN